MTDAHFANFIAGIRTGEKLCACRRGQRRRHHAAAFQHRLGCEPRTASRPTDGKIKNDPEAMKLWDREYEKGWEPV